MPRSTGNKLLIVAAICGLLGTFGDNLHLPQTIIFVALGAAIIVGLLAVRRLRLESAEGSSPVAPQGWFQRRWADKSSRFWIVVVLLGFVAVTAPIIFGRPGETVRANAVISLITFGLGVMLAFIMLRWKRP